MKKLFEFFMLLFFVNLNAQYISISATPPAIQSYKKFKYNTALTPGFPYTNPCPGSAIYLDSDLNFSYWMSKSNINVNLCGGLDSYKKTWNMVLMRVGIATSWTHTFTLNTPHNVLNWISYNGNTSFLTDLNLGNNTYIYDYQSNSTGGIDIISYITFHNFPINLLSIDNFEYSFNIYPNPTQKTLYIDIEKEFTGAIFDISGKSLMTVNTKEVDISSLSAGIYFIKISSEGKQFTKKIIKE